MVVLNINRKKKEKGYLSIIAAMAEKNGSKIDEYDRWRDTIIGIDYTNKKLFFSRVAAQRQIQEVVDLSDVSSCSVNSENQGLKGENYQVIQKIELQMKSKSSKNLIKLPFYDAAYDNLSVQHEFQLSEKWSKKINGILK